MTPVSAHSVGSWVLRACSAAHTTSPAHGAVGTVMYPALICNHVPRNGGTDRKRDLDSDCVHAALLQPHCAPAA
ncbi:hypothetical protein AGIG_G4102 [Arapaima gigas]